MKRIRWHAFVFLSLSFQGFLHAAEFQSIHSEQYRKIIDDVFKEFKEEITRYNANIEIDFHDNSSVTGAF